MKVKVCGITNIDQFRWLDENKMDYIGLNFYPESKRYIKNIDPTILITSVANKVGIFVNADLSMLFKIVEKYDLDLVQLHGNESVAYCDEVAKIVAVIKAFGVDEQFLFSSTEKYLDCCTYFLFDTKSNVYGGSGTKFNWRNLSQYQYSKPFFLSGGIQLVDIPEILEIENNALMGVDVNSGFEISPGNKDLNKISEMMKMITNEKS